MSKTYQEFKDWIVTFLWKEGDQVVLDNLDDLIRMAESELRRDLRVEERHRQASLHITEIKTPLPADFHSVRTLSSLELDLPPFTYVDPGTMVSIIRQHQFSAWRPFYSIIGYDLLLCGPLGNSYYHIGDSPPAAPSNGDLWLRTSDPRGLYMWLVDIDSEQWVQLTNQQSAEAIDNQNAEVVTLILDYVAKVGDYKTLDLSPIEQEYFDLFTYTVLKHAAPFLREDERTPVWDSRYAAALDSAVTDSKFYKERGVSAPKPLPRQAGISRSRRSRFPYTPYLGNSGNSGGTP